MIDIWFFLSNLTVKTLLFAGDQLNFIVSERNISNLHSRHSYNIHRRTILMSDYRQILSETSKSNMTEDRGERKKCFSHNYQQQIAHHRWKEKRNFFFVSNHRQKSEIELLHISRVCCRSSILFHNSSSYILFGYFWNLSTISNLKRLPTFDKFSIFIT